jgi:ketosteroid isomerase-like protein
MPAISDPARLREIAEQGFVHARTDVALVPEEIEIHGDWAFARIRVEGTATPTAGGAPVDIDMKEIVVFRRQSGGAWKIARLISNRND